MFGLLSVGLLLLIGLGLVVVVVILVIVVANSRKEDYVNPFSTPTNHAPNPPPGANISPEVPRNVAPHLYKAPANDQETVLVDFLIGQASAQTGMNLSNDPMVRERMVNAVRLALQNLEEKESAQINLPFLAADAQGPKHFEFKLTRSMMDQVQ
ncbi:MAG TPA: Hsp70 family protein [Anaerolineales bacterium]|nr:Hsp70 family protein [Anaerolineales bacterium]